MTISDLMKAPGNAQLPSYDRAGLKPRIIHLGFGAFARAHWMGYHQDFLLKNPNSDWGVVVSSIRSGAERFGQLAENDHLYSVLEYSDTVNNLRVIGSILKTAHPERGGQDAFFDPYMDPDLAIVSMTLTEKGYCLAGEKLDEKNPAIIHDLANPQEPKSAIGALVEALRRRCAAGLDGFTILSLDNLPKNGKLCQLAVMSYAETLDEELAGWIKANVTFPCSMVDRIVPALTDESYALIKERLGGMEDPNGIVCEPFRQWVIEDNFIKGRPGWEEVGAQFVPDVEPFEDMKLRMLNGSHSFLAYLGYLAGYETIDRCMEDPDFRNAAHQLMVQEQLPTLDVPGDVDLEAYADALIDRFSNSQLKHKTAQIASDGSQKLPQRMLASIAWHIDNGTDWGRLAFGVAGWLRFMAGTDEKGAPTPINDPLADQIAAKTALLPNWEAYIDAVLALDTIFPTNLADNQEFVTRIKACYATLVQTGAKASVATVAN